ncbi:MAG: hypothetical protein HC846_10260 [Blastocatellia bacterium]|nr:hypothetical protein [Blastocatellia bacterium]
MTNFGLVLMTIFLFFGTVFSQSKDEKAKLAIKKVMDEQVAAWNKADLEGFMRGYWNSPEMTFVSGGKSPKAGNRLWIITKKLTAQALNKWAF